jgi:hypothetical protein
LWNKFKTPRLSQDQEKDVRIRIDVDPTLQYILHVMETDPG